MHVAASRGHNLGSRRYRSPVPAAEATGSDDDRLVPTHLADTLVRAMYAVIASGGKQEKVAEGQRVELELLDGDEGSEIALTPVLVVDGDTVLATADQLSGASVTGRIVGSAKGPKIRGFTYKPKSRQRRRYGHRQKYTVVEITSITTG